MNATHGRATLGQSIDLKDALRAGSLIRLLVQRLNASTFWALLGIVALVWWVSYWNAAVKKWHVRPSPATWYEPFQFMSLDFLHNYQASRYWLTTGDPYREAFGDPIGRKLCYPPIVLVYFSWCQLVSVHRAIGIWTITLGAMALLGAWAAWSSRRSLGLTPVPITFALAAVVTSAPVAYALERGNYDLLIVPCIVMAAWGLRRSGRIPDAVVGYAIGLAICLKIYPALLLAALVGMRRYRATAFALIVATAFLSFQSHNIPIFLANLQEIVAQHDAESLPYPSQVAHSIPYSWKALWTGSRLAILARIPGTVAAGAIIGGLLAWVFLATIRSRDPRPAVVPLLFWITAAATFVPKVSNDYNFVFLPMAMLAVWDRRDPLVVHAGLGVVCLILQPIAFPMSTSVTFGFKLIGLVLTAYCLTTRLREQNSTATQPWDSATEGQHAG